MCMRSSIACVWPSRNSIQGGLRPSLYVDSKYFQRYMIAVNKENKSPFITFVLKENTHD